MSLSPEKFNLRNPAVKRILQEMKELQREPSSEVYAEALEGNIFEWHFVIRGPPDTEFQGGVYHGRILLPPEYPFKPPSFLMLSPNGRFETGVKICLSISSHHPEHWQPSWSVRTALTALIAFMPSPGNGAIGSLDYTKEERAALAAKSRVEPPVFGGPDRQKLIEEMHQRALAADDATASGSTAPSQGAAESPTAAASPAGAVSPAQINAAESPDEDRGPETSDAPGGPPAASGSGPGPSPFSAHTHLPGTAGDGPGAGAGPGTSAASVDRAPSRDPAMVQSFLQEYAAIEERAQSMALYGRPPPHSWEDTMLVFLASTLTVLIVAIVFRRLLLITGTDLTAFLSK